LFTAADDEKSQQFHFPLCSAENGKGDALIHAWQFLTHVKRIEFQSESGAWTLRTGTLREDAKVNWDGLTEMLPEDTPLDDDQLTFSMLDWLDAYAATSDRAQQIEYVRHVKRPLTMVTKTS
jgi:hypothetical protein